MSARRLVVGACAVTTLVSSVWAASLPATAGESRADRDPETAPLLGLNRADVLDGQYIVVLEPRSGPAARAAAAEQARRGGGSVTHEYGAALNGFAARLPGRAVEALRRNPHVEYIEADQQVSVSATQDNPTWGLDRIDQRNRPLNSRYVYDRTGAGVTAYIVDTGIRATHNQFGSRVLGGFTAVNDGRGTADCNGHGSHVAGTVGANRFGVAKGVTLRPVRVLNCQGSGSNAQVIAGIDWVTEHHTGGAPAVANMSLGGGPSLAIDDALSASILDGVTYAVAAGNESTDACAGSPARLGAALTVGSTTRTDARSGFSNFGRCLDLFAPGSSVTSTWNTGDTATNTISGTSMASPHVAGAAALFLQANPSALPTTVSEALVDQATTDLVTGRGSGSPNRLLYSRGSTVMPPASPAGLLANPGFESGVAAWSASAGVIDDSSNPLARTGRWKAWLGGWGSTHTDTLEQAVAIPAAPAATLSFRLYVTTAESTATVFDTLSVQVQHPGGTTEVARYSNRQHGSSYVERRLDLSAYTGQLVTLRFVGTEDSSVPTSFLVDDVSFTTG